MTAAMLADDLLETLDHHLTHRDGAALGYGSDEYHPEPQEHPMAYALYLRGLTSLFRATAERRYLDHAERCGRRLLELRSPDAPGWGLGFRWKDAERDTPYTITTALCAWALLEHALATGDSDSLQAAHESCTWLARGVPWSVIADGAGPWYSPDQPYVLPNVVAITAGALSSMSAVSGDAQLRASAQAAARFVERAEVDRGCWPYGFAGKSRSGNVRPENVVDLTHSAYVLDGIVGTGGALGSAALLAAAGRAAEFIRTHFIGDGGRCIEKLVLVRRDDPATHKLLTSGRRLLTLAGGQSLVAFSTESRVWGYGALFRAFARCEPTGLASLDALAPVIARVLTHQCATQDGRFTYLPDDPAAYPRQEAHLFDGLAAVVEALATR